MNRRDRATSPFWRVWRWPIVLSALTMFGLLSALLGQHGLWRWLSWVALGIPLVVIVFYAACAAIPKLQTRMAGLHAGQVLEAADLNAVPAASKEATR